jgi:hypothetical protein
MGWPVSSRCGAVVWLTSVGVMVRIMLTRSRRLAMPGKYFVTIDKLENNSITPFSDTISFQCKKLYQSSFPDTERVAINDFYNKVSELTRAVSAADVYLQELVNKIKYIKVALLETPKSSARWYAEVRGLELALNGITIRLNGVCNQEKCYVTSA